jgi:DNA-binding NarL/FixJ family response regulator
MLTGREHEILHLVAHGMRTQAIALQLGIAETTVITFIRTARKKLGARNRAQAALLATGGIAPSSARGVLDPEQLRLLAVLGKGRTVAEAARELHLSRRTAQRRLADIRSRLGVPTTAAAVARGAPDEIGVGAEEPERERREGG